MNANFNLALMVKKAMSDLIASNALSLIEITKDEVLLKSKTFAIDIFSDKEGVSLVYYDTGSKPVNGYNIFLFMFHKRHDSLFFPTGQAKPSDYESFIESQLITLAQHLRVAGQDILGGSKNWINEYLWPVVVAGPNLSKYL